MGKFHAEKRSFRKSAAFWVECFAGQITCNPKRRMFMPVLSFLYQLLVGPLELFFEIIFALVNKVIANPGFSIIFLSLVMNFLVLPLYKKADAMQAEERDIEKKLKPWVTHIKKTFRGDERFMMLQTYYRQNHYKPYYALKGSVSLLLEIPFFIAAYRFLSGLSLLHGFAFGPVEDLGAPDALLTIGGATINVLPILMTAVNIISSAIYARDLSAKSKIQLYGMALIFLILLYQSPAGLVFYWTLNNVFSLLKNIFYKLKNPRLVLSILLSLASAGFIAVIYFVKPLASSKQQAAVTIFLVLLQLPLLLYFFEKRKCGKEPRKVTRKENQVFYLGCLFLALLTGILIPLSVLSSSPEEFINKVTFSNPLHYLFSSAALAFGTFVIWFSIFYRLIGADGKRMMGFAVWAVAGISVANYMLFGKEYGMLTAGLTFEKEPQFLLRQQFINLIVIAAVLGLFYLIWKKKKEFAGICCAAACFAVVGMSLLNIVQVQKIITDKNEQLVTDAKETANIPLHKDGKNVIVLMLDRAISPFVPYMLNEKPELLTQFDGFTFYPNTMSYGGYTNVGTPPLYGGYDYVPVEMNCRADISLCDKQNEALKVMPVLFDSAGFETTVCDPTYAGYEWIPDLSIYDDYPRIHKYITMNKFNLDADKSAAALEKKLNRDFFCYSIFKISPVCCQSVIYDGGKYNHLVNYSGLITDEVIQEDGDQTIETPSRATGIKPTFMGSYATLAHLPFITEVKDSGKNTFVMISNDTTHEPTLLREPEYEPASVVDNTEFDAANVDRFTLNGRTIRMENEIQMSHYHVNMAAFLQLGKWFDYMREKGVYDNTRIIIVSDHGDSMNLRDDMLFGSEGYEDVARFNPLLMVKDFNSRGVAVDDRFMTNADVPALAVGGLMQDPVNPFTGEPILRDCKKDEQYILFTKWNISDNNGNQFTPGVWLSVHDNVHDTDNWKVISEDTILPNP